MYQLHHKTYERLGYEELDDLEPLCEAHHREVHGLVPENSFKAYKRKQRAWRKIFVEAYGPWPHPCYFNCGKPVDGHTKPFDRDAAVIHHIDESGTSSTPNNAPSNLASAHNGCHLSYHLRGNQHTLGKHPKPETLEKMKATQKKRYQDPEEYAKLMAMSEKAQAANRGRKRTPEQVENIRNGSLNPDGSHKADSKKIASSVTKLWEDPEYRARANARKPEIMKERWANDAYRTQKKAEARLRWEDPKYREEMLKAQEEARARPGYRETQRQGTLARWQNPVEREKMLAYRNDPDFRALHAKRTYEGTPRACCVRCKREMSVGNLTRHHRAYAAGRSTCQPFIQDSGL